MNTSSTFTRKSIAAILAAITAVSMTVSGFTSTASAASCADGPSAAVRVLDWNNDGVFNYKDPVAALKQGGAKIAPVVKYMKDLLKNRALPRAKVLACSSYQGAKKWVNNHEVIHKSVKKIDGRSENWAILCKEGKNYKLYEIVIDTRKKSPYYPK